jgi:large subunit ribosomal protein L11
MKHIYEIAKIKMQDVKGVQEEQVSSAALVSNVHLRTSTDLTPQLSSGLLQMCKVIAGSARSMGLRIVR